VDRLGERLGARSGASVTAKFARGVLPPFRRVAKGGAWALCAGLHRQRPRVPLYLVDFISLDTLVPVMQAPHEGLVDLKYRPLPLFVKYFEPGWLGNKTQRG
jgi:3-hydroxyacyl-CoA dehydrogenase